MLVQFLPIHHDDKGPVAGNGAQYLLAEEDHRQGFPAALCVPEDPKTPASPFPVDMVDLRFKEMKTGFQRRWADFFVSI